MPARVRCLWKQQVPTVVDKCELVTHSSRTALQQRPCVSRCMLVLKLRPRDAHMASGRLHGFALSADGFSWTHISTAYTKLLIATECRDQGRSEAWAWPCDIQQEPLTQEAANGETRNEVRHRHGQPLLWLQPLGPCVPQPELCVSGRSSSCAQQPFPCVAGSPPGGGPAAASPAQHLPACPLPAATVFSSLRKHPRIP